MRKVIWDDLTSVITFDAKTTNNRSDFLYTRHYLFLCVDFFSFTFSEGSKKGR